MSQDKREEMKLKQELAEAECILLKMREEIEIQQDKVKSLQMALVMLNEDKIANKSNEAARESGGTQVLAAVWEDEDDNILEEGTMNLVQFSTPLTDNKQPNKKLKQIREAVESEIEEITTFNNEDRVKVTRKEAYSLQANAKTISEAANEIVKKVLGKEPCNLTSDDLEAYECLVVKVRRMLGDIKKDVRKAKKVMRPDEIFLSLSMCEEFKVE